MRVTGKHGLLSAQSKTGLHTSFFSAIAPPYDAVKQLLQFVFVLPG